ncbi:MAG: ferritin family protein [Proteobacteria bacterium]|nr:ferritin family protein [Pseudomonadota bacterium]MBU1583378.1 ferritin family protein [Pseudomonadota bacterium]MBU2455979.1 ferritin family protein [Pseudomonadota bacterium]MBU2629620.1 ferritin family protein [Pseudomonadota bacterium]
MDKSNTLTILKNAFLIERKGKSLYEKARDHAKDDTVKAFFNDLVNDEQEHMNILEKQFKAYMKSGKFMAGGFENNGGAITAPDILDETLKDKINAAGFEATAITAAISFEEKAVKLYSQRAQEATDPEEKKMYNWLSTWEKTHLKKLMALDASLIESVWHDNNFWPF